MSTPFSFVMDESNDGTDGSCTILVRCLDLVTGVVRSQLLVVPVINIDMAEILFQALKYSLEKHALKKAVVFMSDATIVMKQARSGGCICRLADLAVKAGVKALPVDMHVDQLFIGMFYHFHHGSKRKQQDRIP